MVKSLSRGGEINWGRGGEGGGGGEGEVEKLAQQLATLEVMLMLIQMLNPNY